MILDCINSKYELPRKAIITTMTTLGDMRLVDRLLTSDEVLNRDVLAISVNLAIAAVDVAVLIFESIRILKRI